MEILLIKKARAEKAEKGGESHHIKHKVKRLEVESINENNIHKKNIHEDKEKEKDFEEVIEELQEMNLIENENKEKNEKKI